MATLSTLLTEHLDRLRPAADSGVVGTGVAGVELFWARRPVPRAPLLYKPSIVLVAQGHKVGYLGARSFRYDAQTYLVVGVPIPFDCEIHATPEAPLLGLRVEVDLLGLHELVARVGAPGTGEHAAGDEPHSGMEPVAMDDGLLQATTRLVSCLPDPLDREVLGASARNEVIYRALRSEHGRVLYDLTQHHTRYGAIARALERLHAHVEAPTPVEVLARTTGMSVSAFHRAFKQVTGDSPLQYVKKVRLDKARGLLMHQQVQVSEAAYAVGYESASQFSREFKRHFRISPSDARAEAVSAAL